ncbi:MAG: nucleoside hydrolase [Anaerolineae bacterium]|nr:nucleoside hydrolase [Anaerolineae bacterium]
MNSDARERKVPRIPAKGERLRVVIDSDAKNEIDDQWAIALAILSPERFQIEGFVGANYDNARGGPDGIEKSVREIELILDKAGQAGRWPVLHGSHPMRYAREPSPSEGMEFIIERALASSPDDPLWVIGLGAATDMASAYLKEPRIVDRVVAFWHLRTRWPEKCYNFNVFGDVRAARLLFHSPLSFVLFDTGTYLTCPMEESERRVRPYGELGAYLHNYRHTSPAFMSPRKGFFDLGDIAALLDPDLACWEQTACPEVDWDLDYVFRDTLGSILRCYHIDRDGTFALLYDRLERYFGHTS